MLMPDTQLVFDQRSQTVNADRSTRHFVCYDGLSTYRDRVPIAVRAWVGFGLCIYAGKVGGKNPALQIRGHSQTIDAEGLKELNHVLQLAKEFLNGKP